MVYVKRKLPKGIKKLVAFCAINESILPATILIKKKKKNRRQIKTKVSSILNLIGSA